MLILLDCRPLQRAGTDSEKTRFILACATELAVRQGVEWLYLLDEKGGSLPLPEGATRLFRKTFRGGAGDKIWYDWLIPRLARRHKVQLVMTTGGRMADSGKLPQRCWKQSGKGLFLSYAGTDIPVLPAPDEWVTPLSAEDRERVKREVAEGKEYFFADITGVGASGVVNLLKAFSLFKKRQLSNMKLVLSGAASVDKLDSYKYRQDVCLYSGTGREQVEGAYAVVSLPRRDSLGIAVLNAWKARVPVISSDDGEGVMRVPVDDPGALADALKSLYKDEGFRKELIGKGTLRVADFSLQQSVATIWDAIGRN